jgi:hypothetical protein
MLSPMPALLLISCVCPATPPTNDEAKRL